MAHLVGQLLSDDEPDPEAMDVLVKVLGRSLNEIREGLGRPEEEDQDEEGEEADAEEVPEGQPSIICTTLVGAKGLSAGYVFIVGFNNEHLPRYPNAIADEEVCQFLVGLSRTRKECHLISVGRLGAQPRSPSVFATWISQHLEERSIKAADFK